MAFTRLLRKIEVDGRSEIDPNDGLSTSKQRYQPGRGGRGSRRKDKSESRPNDFPTIWKTGPVYTATEKPFSTLQQYDAVVRYRSDFGVMLEVAVPNHDLKKMQQKLGTRLEVLSKDHGARVEVQQLSAPATISGVENARIISVLVSGTFMEAQNVMKHISGYKGATRKTDMKLRHTVYSQLARPSATLTPMDKVWRKWTAASSSLEVSVPESQFMQFVASSSIEALAKKYNVKIEVGEPEQRPTNKQSSGTAMARSFLISGIEPNIYRAHDCIQSRRLRQNGQQSEPGNIIRSSHHDQNPARSSKTSQRSAESVKPLSQPPAESESIRPIAGRSAADYKVCSAIIVGPNSAQLRELIVESSVPPHQELKTKLRLPPTVHVMLGEVKDEIIVTGLLSAIGDFRVSLESAIRELCASRGLSAHDVQFDVKAFEDATSQHTMLVTCLPTLSGPNADHLWSMVLGELVEGWRVFGHSPCHVNKRDDSLTLKGTTHGVGEAVYRIRLRVSQLCKEMDLPEHPLSVPRHRADPAQNALLVDNVRDTLRTLTHPVVLITSNDSTVKEFRISDFRGVTVSSFNAVTLEPAPIVSFNLKLPSRTWDSIKASQRFNVHFLSATPRGAAIADVFTRPLPENRSGFTVLQEMGMYVRSMDRKRNPPTVFDPRGGVVQAWASCHLLLHKCVEVGDHVIVFGMVRDIKVMDESEDKSALSYSMRGYRNGTGRIEPDFKQTVLENEGRNDSSNSHSHSQIDTSSTAAQSAQYALELDPLRLGEENDVEPAAISQTQADSRSSDADEDLDDPVYKALASARAKVRREEEADLYEAFNTQTIDSMSEHGTVPQNAESEKRAAVARQEEEEYDLGFDEPDHGNQLSTSDTSSGQTTVSDAGSPQANAAPSNAWGLQSSTKRAFSTYARPLSMLYRPPLPPYRHASTLATPTNRKDISHILDPATAQSTVADYLSLSDTTYDEAGHFRLYTRQSSVRGSLTAQKDISRLQTILSRGYTISPKTGQDIALTPEDISSINHRILVFQRKITVNLAVNAMRTLRDMLDKARYGELFGGACRIWRVRWSREARELRGMLDGGKIDGERYEKISEVLKGRYDGMMIEVGRLRQVTEEEGDGGVKGYDDDDDDQ
ncbi:Putative flavin reductase like domain, FMN-binding split barrel [Septoria linicola]|uniref:Flavin reductase like domain, FMN-binding split barrel n=1 Tax=Septoria linicola TaxID=215465 RepID=A0A9Q9EQE2_9PEZI|nr:Putative flavin reductase like domain, FMN-binding split barrel [Septoria linicola]